VGVSAQQTLISVIVPMNTVFIGQAIYAAIHDGQAVAA